MKKPFWIIRLLLAITLPIGIIWGLRQYQLKQFNTLHHARNLTIIEDIPSISVIGTHHNGPFENQVIFFSQSDESSAISQEIQNHLDSLTPRHEGLLSQEWLVIFPRTKKEPLLKGVNAYDLVQETYQAKGIETKLAHEEIISTFYASVETGKSITLNDLIVDKDSFRKTLDSLLQSTKENQSEDLKAFHRRFLARFDTDDWSAIDFLIIDHSIAIDGYFSLNYFVDSLNPDYFSKETLDKYRKENEDLQALVQSPDTTTTNYD